jgi:ribosomal protein L11 methyltransferase
MAATSRFSSASKTSLASHPALDLRYSPASQTSDVEGLIYATLDDLQPTAVHEHESADGWRVFFRTGAQRDHAAAVIAATIGSTLTTIKPVDVDDENWAERSQASLKAVRVGRLVVAPPWKANGMADDKDALIVIIPSMGFGTGHHATTRLCLELLQQLPLQGRRVIDVGTGSGVLAIAACKLGARSVLAVDYDVDALENARENVALNGATGSIELREADLSSFESPEPFDVVTANLTATVIQKHAPGLRRLVHPGGQLILSGFEANDAAEVARAFGIDASRELAEGEWAALSITIPTRI